MKYLKSFKFWIVSLVAIYSCVGFLLLPWFLTAKVPDIINQKTGINIQIQQASFNPYSFELSLEDVLFQDVEKNPVLEIKQIYLNYSLLALLEKTILIQSFEISKPKIYATLLKDGTINFEHVMPKTTQIKENESTQKEQINLPKIVLQQVLLSQGSLYFKDEKRDFSLDLGPYDFNAYDISSQKGNIISHNFSTNIQSGGQVLLEGGISLQPLQLYGTVKVTELQLPSLYDYALPSIPARLAHGKISLTLPYQIDLQDAFDLKIAEAYLNLKALNLLYQNEQIIDISNIDVKGINLSYPAQDITIKSLHVKRPTIIAILDKDKNINFQNAFLMSNGQAEKEQTQGKQTKPWSYSLADAFIEGLRVKFFDNSLAKDTYVQISDTNFTAKDISSEKSLRIPYNLKASINNNAKLHVDGDILQKPLQITSNIDLKSLHVKDFENYILPHVNFLIEDAKIDADAQLQANLEATPNIRASANAYINSLAINSLENSSLLSWKQLAIQKIDFNQNPLSLNIGVVDLKNPFIKLKINKDGTTNFSNITKQTPKSNEAKKEEKKDTMKLKIGPMAIASANADFSDLSLPFPFRTLIHDLNGGLSELDFQKSTPSNIKIDGKIDEYGYANIKGSLIPLEIKKYANIDVTFKNIDLNSLTPYSGKFVGQKIESGKLSMDLKYAIDKASLKGSNKLNIDTLTLGEKVESPDALNLPLELAIALLKDSNNQIDIDLPVAGDMNNPDFSYGGVVWRAVGNLITGIVTAPFRFLGNMLGIDGEKLKTIDFALGKSEIINTEHEKLENLEKILGKRPGIKLTIKGSYDEALDRKVLQEEALKKSIENTHKAIKEKIKDEKIDTYALALKELYLQSNEPQKYEELQKSFLDPKSDALDVIALNKAIETELMQKITISKETLIALGDKRAQSIKNELVINSKIDSKRIEILPSENSAAARDEWIEVKLDIKS
jgi:hypothetical protein